MITSPAFNPPFSAEEKSSTDFTYIPTTKLYFLAVVSSKSIPEIPIKGLLTLLYWINWDVISVVEFIGIAKPIPSIPEPDSFNVLIPITLPWALTNAPPLLPEFIAASV